MRGLQASVEFTSERAMIELTRDDLAAIRNALGERYPIDERDQAIYRAGLAAGIERAA